MITYFKSSLIFTFFSFLLAGFIGFYSSGDLSGVLEILLIVLVLSVLEVSLSFENAVVNAKYLKNMDPVWRKRFLTWGMLIAVFGMRIILPLVIVSVVAHMSMFETLSLAFSYPDEYERILESSHNQILGFGGSFLLMVGLRYFFDIEKDVHWVKVIEEPLVKAGKLYMVEASIAIISLLTVSSFLDESKKLDFLIAGLVGLIVYVLVQWISAILNYSNLAGNVVKSGLATFIYLEILDASFSFDGVVGAFALSNNILVIALGLGVGAMFVRSLTLMFVDKGVLDNFRFLEHGAFWAVIFLALFMIVGVFIHVAEFVTGLFGAVIICLSLYSSYKHNKNKLSKINSN